MSLSNIKKSDNRFHMNKNWQVSAKTREESKKEKRKAKREHNYLPVTQLSRVHTHSGNLHFYMVYS